MHQVLFGPIYLHKFATCVVLQLILPLVRHFFTCGFPCFEMCIIHLGTHGCDAGPSQATQEQSDPQLNTHKSDGGEGEDINRVAQFTFGGTVPLGQDVLLGDCSTTSTDVLKPCEWRVGPAEAKGIAKYRIFF